MWIAIGIVGGLLAVIIVVVAIGATFPKDHHFTRTVRLKKSPDEIWKVITDVPNASSWNNLTKSVERKPDKDGHEVWFEVMREGPPMTLVTLESKPPTRWVRSIGDEKQAFSGEWVWTLELLPAVPGGGQAGSDGGTKLTLTENGLVPNPLFRFMVRVVGPGQYIERYLRGLAKHFGEPGAAVETPPG